MQNFSIVFFICRFIFLFFLTYLIDRRVCDAFLYIFFLFPDTRESSYEDQVALSVSKKAMNSSVLRIRLEGPNKFTTYTKLGILTNFMNPALLFMHYTKNRIKTEIGLNFSLRR